MTTHDFRHTCPYCEAELTSVSEVADMGGGPPTPGDATICLECSQWCIFNEDLSARKPNEEELAVLKDNPLVTKAEALVLELQMRGGKAWLRTMKEPDVHSALQFSRMMISGGLSLQPMLVASKKNDHLMLGPRPMEGNEKEVTFSVMAAAARAWGGTKLVFISDAWILKTDAKDPLPDKPLEEHPDSKEAIIISVFSPDVPMWGIVQPYDRGSEGIDFGPVEMLPTGDPTGLVPHIMHSALALTDEQIWSLLEVIPGSGDSRDPNKILEAMKEAGYSVIQG